MTRANEYERRRYKRFMIDKDTLAFSIAGIGRIEEISNNGFSAHFTTDSYISNADVVVMSILVRNSSVWVNKLVGKKIWQGRFQHSSFSGQVSQKRGYQFIKPSKVQQQQIDKIIKKYSKTYDE